MKNDDVKKKLDKKTINSKVTKLPSRVKTVKKSEKGTEASVKFSGVITQVIGPVVDVLRLDAVGSKFVEDRGH